MLTALIHLRAPSVTVTSLRFDLSSVYKHGKADSGPRSTTGNHVLAQKRWRVCCRSSGISCLPQGTEDLLGSGSMNLCLHVVAAGAGKDVDDAAERHGQPWHHHPVGKMQEAIRARAVIAHAVERHTEPVQLTQPMQQVHRVVRWLLHAPGLQG